MDYCQKKIEYIKSSIKRCYFEAYQSNKALFRTSRNTNTSNEIVALSYLSKAISIMESCKAVYFSSLEDLENSSVEDIFNKFETYSNEVLSNFSEDHSHQWSNIEFNAFKDSISELINLPFED